MAEEKQNGWIGNPVRKVDLAASGTSLWLDIGAEKSLGREITKRVRVPEHLIDLFEDLSDDSDALQAKYNYFCTAIHEEQKALAIRAKELWTQTIALLKLEGTYRYKDGFVHPIDPPEQK